VTNARRTAAVACAALLCACSRGAAPDGGAASDAAIPDAGAPATAPADADAGTAAPPADAGTAAERRDAMDGGAAQASSAPLTVAVAVAGGQELALARDGSSVVDPGAAFRVEIATHLTDARLALHDETDAMVASTGTTEVGASWTRFRLVPDEPLRPGSAYVLRVDGAHSRDLHDPAGRAYAPIALKLKTSGERPAAPPRKKPPRGKRH
jgi:hypothetical protein